jgi:hypothetical protein
VLAAKSFAGNLYDCHTLADTVAQAEHMTASRPNESTPKRTIAAMTMTA